MEYIKYCLRTDECYHPCLKYDSIPVDVESITLEKHQEFFLSSPPSGKVRVGLAWVDTPVPSEAEIITINESNAKLERISLLSNMTFDGAIYQTDNDGLINIEKAIQIADDNKLPETTTKSWRLLDNSSRITSLAELRIIKKMHDQRYIDVWDAFNAWHDTDKLAPFSYGDD